MSTFSESNSKRIANGCCCLIRKKKKNWFFSIETYKILITWTVIENSYEFNAENTEKTSVMPVKKPSCTNICTCTYATSHTRNRCVRFVYSMENRTERFRTVVGRNSVLRGRRLKRRTNTIPTRTNKIQKNLTPIAGRCCTSPHLYITKTIAGGGDHKAPCARAARKPSN